MARYDLDWDGLGRSIQEIIDQANNSRDYRKLNQTIRQVVERAVDIGGEAVRKTVDTVTSSSQEPKQTPVVEKKPLPVLYGSTSGKTTRGAVKVVGGGMLSFFTFLGLCACAMVEAVAGGMAFPMGMALAGMAVGLGLLGSGVKTLGRVKRFKTYRRTLGQKTQCSLEKLARSVGKSVKFVRRELWQMIGEGLFLEGHMDKEETCLITSHETYRQFEQSRLLLEQRQKQEAEEKEKKASTTRDPRVQEVLDKGNAFIAEIRRCNDAIPGEAVSAKIYRMEGIVQRIFERAEAHPEIVPDLKKMMDYYLPMTVKLLNAYADMDAQPVQGETIQASKREIEDTLDTLNLAFERLLDSVFKDTAMDVSSDISVLQTLLAQEGLTEDDFSKMKKEKTF